MQFIDLEALTKTYDALHRSKHPAALMGRAVQLSGVARLVGVVQNNGNVKNEAKYLAVKNLQYVLSTFELFLVLPSLYWLLRWADFFAFFVSE